MTCPNCHSKIDDSNKYCNYCGKKLNESELNEHEQQFNYSNQYSNTDKSYDENHDDQFSYSILYSNMFNKTISSDEDYLKTYVGKNYERIKSEKFSIPAFLLGPLYLYYRKLWLRATILIIIYCALMSYQNSSISTICSLLIFAYLGFKFDNFYLNHVEKEIEQIKISNPDKSSTELLDICQKKGGTVSPYAILIAFLAIFFLINIIVIPIMGFILYSNESITPIFHEYSEGEYKKLEKMNYKVPTSSKASDYNNDSYHYYSTLNNTDYDCSFTLSTDKYTNLYQSPDNYIKRNISVGSNEKVITADTEINNTTWKYISITSTARTENYYVTMKDKVLYIIEIRGYGDSKVSACKNAENDLINSIYFDTNQTTK